jgi:hypothetical protein
MEDSIKLLEAQRNVQEDFIFGHVFERLSANDANEDMVRAAILIVRFLFCSYNSPLTYTIFCVKLADCQGHKIYLLEKIKGSASKEARYISHPINMGDVLYAGSEQFNNVVSSLDGILGFIPSPVVCDLRVNGPHVLGSDLWQKIQYMADDSGSQAAMNMYRSDYNCKLPGSVRESFIALQATVRVLVAKLLGVDSLSSEEVEQDYTKLETVTTKPQPPHLDFLRSILRKLRKYQKYKRLYLAVFPLNPDGMMLQVWDNKLGGAGKLLFLPKNSILILPGNTVHGGGFMTNPGGNVRGHLYIAVNHNLPEGVDKVLIPSGPDVYVDYTINEHGKYHPANCLVTKGLVQSYGPCVIKKKICWGVFRKEKVDKPKKGIAKKNKK